MEAGFSIAVIGGIAGFGPIIACSKGLTQNDNAIAAPFESRFNRVSQPHSNAIPDDQSINHRFNRVRLAFLQPDRLGLIQFPQLSIDARTNKSFALEFFEYIPEFTLLTFNQWCQYNNFAAWFVGQILIDYLRRRLPTEWSIKFWPTNQAAKLL